MANSTSVETGVYLLRQHRRFQAASNPTMQPTHVERHQMVANGHNEFQIRLNLRQAGIGAEYLQNRRMRKMYRHRTDSKEKEAPVSSGASFCYLFIIFAFIVENSSSVIKPCCFNSASSLNSSIVDFEEDTLGSSVLGRTLSIATTKQSYTS